MEEWFRRCGGLGLPIEDKHLSSIFFADDQVVMAQDREDLELMMRKLEDSYSGWGIRINFEKSKYMMISGNEEDDLNGKKYERVKNFKYLGSVLEEEGGSAEKK